MFRSVITTICFVVLFVSFVQSFTTSELQSSLFRTPKVSTAYRLRPVFKCVPGATEISFKEVPEVKSDIPTLRQLLMFGLPTLGVWLLQPILSLIDTSVIGMSSAASDITQLAALGPGIAWIDGSAYLCYFIGIATTNLYAEVLKQDDSTKGEVVLSHAFVLSCYLGVLLFTVQYFFSEFVITVLSGTSPQIIKYGVTYAKIRAFSSLVAVPTIVAQSACLAREDAVTPLRAALVGSSFNILGDVLLVFKFGMGLAGAAVATTLSQIATAIYLLFSLSNAASYGLRDSSSRDNPITAIKRAFESVRRLAGRIKYPSVSEALTFISFCGPLFFILLAKSFLWSFTTYACSTSGAAHLAAHQVIINFFLFLVIFGDVTSQMSQTYLPSLLLRKNTKDERSAGAGATTAESSSEFRRRQEEVDLGDAAAVTISRILKISGVSAIINFGVGYSLPRYGHKYLTRSLELASLIMGAAPLLGVATLLQNVAAGLEGVIIAARDSHFHTMSYVVSGACFLIYQSIVRMNSLGLNAVWYGLVGFQMLRFLLFGSRVRHLQNKLRVSVRPVKYKNT